VNVIETVGLALILPSQTDTDDPVDRAKALLTEVPRPSAPASPQGQERKAVDELSAVGRGGAHAP